MSGRVYIFLGPPGGGKGTQAKKLSEEFSLPHIVMGDILRNVVRTGSDVGKLAEEYLERGLLVPDDLTIDLARERLKRDDCKEGFILDGFPRTINQAEELEILLKDLAHSLERIIYIWIPLEVALLRLSERRSCRECGAVYHLKFNPPQGDVCEKCGGELYQRHDDKEEIVKERFLVYERETKPLIDYYKTKGKLLFIEGKNGIQEIFENILSSLSGSEPRPARPAGG